MLLRLMFDAICGEVFVASKQELHQLVGRLMTDAKLHAQAKNDPVAAAKSAGIHLTPEQEKWLASKPAQFDKMMTVASSAYSQDPGGENCGTCIVDGH